jgi:hypothetical protein
MIEPQRLWNTGSPAFAGDDGCGRDKPGDDDIPKTPPCGPGSKLRERRWRKELLHTPSPQMVVLTFRRNRQILVKIAEKTVEKTG